MTSHLNMMGFFRLPYIMYWKDARQIIFPKLSKWSKLRIPLPRHTLLMLSPDLESSHQDWYLWLSKSFQKNISLCFCVLKSCPLSLRHTHASPKHILVLLFLSFHYVPTVFGILYPSEMLVHYRENTFFPKMKKMLRNEFKGLIESQI